MSTDLIRTSILFFILNNLINFIIDDCSTPSTHLSSRWLKSKEIVNHSTWWYLCLSVSRFWRHLRNGYRYSKGNRCLAEWTDEVLDFFFWHFCQNDKSFLFLIILEWRKAKYWLSIRHWWIRFPYSATHNGKRLSSNVTDQFETKQKAKD